MNKTTEQSNDKTTKVKHSQATYNIPCKTYEGAIFSRRMEGQREEMRVFWMDGRTMDKK